MAARGLSLYLTEPVLAKLRERSWRSLSSATVQIIERYDYLVGLQPPVVLSPLVREKFNYYVKEELPDHPLLLSQFSAMVEPELRPFVKDLTPLGVVAFLDRLEQRLTDDQKAKAQEGESRDRFE